MGTFDKIIQIIGVAIHVDGTAPVRGLDPRADAAQ